MAHRAQVELDAFIRGEKPESITHSSIRSLHWKLMLDVINMPDKTQHDASSILSRWRLQLGEHRKAYEKVISNIRNHPIESNDGADLSINNPLSMDDDSPWSKFFEDNELTQLIKQDVLRTHPSNEFFQNDVVQKQLQNILFVWSKQNTLSYRQGMNELLAPLLLVVSRDSQLIDSSCSIEYCELFHSDYIEHDTFALFDIVMTSMRSKFEYSATIVTNDDSNDTSIVSRCEYVQNVMLASVDEELHRHLVAIKVQPQIYGLRWIRLLFSREFSLDKVIVLWDTIFSFGFAFAEDIAVAMLLAQRQQLLCSDNSDALRLLLTYPPTNPNKLIVIAQNYARHTSSNTISPCKPSTQTVTSKHIASAQNSHESVGSESSITHRRSASPIVAVRQQLKALFHAGNSNASSSSANELSELKEKLSTHRITNAKLGERLSAIIQRMQLLYSDKMCNRVKEQSDDIDHCLAEAKMIKDVLIGLLPAESVLSSTTTSATATMNHPLT